MGGSSEMMRIGLLGESSWAACYREAARRLPDVEPAFLNSMDSLDDWDAVIVLTELKSRADAALRAARAGKHLLVASPIAETAEQALELIDACRELGLILMAGLSMRFQPSLMTIKTALSEGKLGEPGLLRIHLWQSSLIDNPYISPQLTGGLDLANWFFSALPDTVFALAGHGYLQVHLGFPGGGMALLDLETSLPDGDSYTSVSLIGSTGAAYADDHHNRNLLFNGGAPRAIEAGLGDYCLLNQLREFVESLQANCAPQAGGEAYMQAMLVAEAVRRSVVSGASLVDSEGAYEPA
jgi:predicted dehydrogenase